MQFDHVKRIALIALVFTSCLVVNAASAETMILACQPQAEGNQPVQVRIDLEKKAITYYGRADMVGPANITDATITARLPSNPINPSEYEDIAIDRATGLLSFRHCNPSRCSGTYFADCHKVTGF